MQDIFTAFEQWFCVHAPAPEHVVGMEEGGAVEGDGGEGVDAVEDEFYMLAGQCGGVDVEMGLVLPVVEADPLNLCFLVTVEGVGDDASGDEVGLYGAGDVCGQPGGCF